MNNDYYVDFNQTVNYILQYLYESDPIRRRYHTEVLRRSALALQGTPLRNLYQEELTSNIKKITDTAKREQYLKKCEEVPKGESFALLQAIENRANQVAGGVSSYECRIDDPYMVVDDETEDRLAAQCEQDYIENELESFASVFSNDLDTAGVAAVLVKYDPKKERNKIIRINPKNIWWDTKYSSTGQERFRAYSVMISFARLLKIIEQDGDQVNTNIKAPDRSIIDGKTIKAGSKYSNRKIRTLNGLSIYVQDINKLATSPDLQGFLGDYAEYQHDLFSCYNLNYYRTFATCPKAQTTSPYGGDDVELTVLYDLENGVEYKIINRRYVISANSRAFRRKIRFETTDINGLPRTITKEYQIQCPLKFRFEKPSSRDLAPYPLPPIRALYGLHDQLCAWRSKRDHVTKLLSILRLETNAADADSLRGLLNIMGIVMDNIQGDINSLQLAYDYTPIDSQIQYLEDTIKKTLHAYDDFDAMQFMGDRASSAEAGLANGAIARGLATHLIAIQQLYSDIARQCIGNRVVYSKENTFRIQNQGGYDVVTLQELASLVMVNAQPKLAVQSDLRTKAANAITLLGTLGETASEEQKTYLIRQAMFDQMPRKVAAAFNPAPVSEQALQNNALEAQNMAQALQQNEQSYMQNPVPYEIGDMMQNSSPEQIDQVIAGLGGGAPAPEGEADLEMLRQAQAAAGASPENLERPGQEGAMAMAGLEGLTPDAGSALANPSGYYG